MMRLLSVVCLLLAAQPALANLLERFGASPRMNGRGKAGGAVVHGWAATWANPAGLTPTFKGPLSAAVAKGAIEPEAKLKATAGNVHIARSLEEAARLKREQKRTPGNSLGMTGYRMPDYHHEVGIALSYQNPRMSVKPQGNSHQARRYANGAAEDLDYAIVQAGVSVDIREVLWTPYDIPVALGFIGAFNADGTVSKVPTLNEDRYQFKRLGNNVNVLSVMLGFSVEPWPDRLSIGFSPGSAATVNGAAEVRDVSLDKNDPIDLNLVADITSKPAPVVGVQYRQPLPVGNLYTGVVYRMHRQSPSTFEVDTELPLGVTSSSETAGLVSIAPHILAVGTGYEYKGFLFLLDLEWQGWSKLPANPARAYEEPQNFRDILIVRAGAEAPLYGRLFPQGIMQTLRFTGRVGYEYEPGITGTNNGAANRLDSEKHLFSFGFSRVFGASSFFRTVQILDFFFSVQVWQTRSVAKRAGTDFAQGSPQPGYRFSGVVWQSGLSYTIVF